jgi:hypothetical protein
MKAYSKKIPRNREPVGFHNSVFQNMDSLENKSDYLNTMVFPFDGQTKDKNLIEKIGLLSQGIFWLTKVNAFEIY